MGKKWWERKKGGNGVNFDQDILHTCMKFSNNKKFLEPSTVLDTKLQNQITHSPCHLWFGNPNSEQTVCKIEACYVQMLLCEWPRASQRPESSHYGDATRSALSSSHRSTLSWLWISLQPAILCLPSLLPPGFTVWDCLTFNVLFKVLILWSFSFTDGFLHRLTKDFLSSFLVEGRRSPRGDRLACSSDL